MSVPEHFPRISENFGRLPKTFEEDPKMFRWCTNEFKNNLRDKLDISEIIDIFSCEDIVSFLTICYHLVYHWLLYNKRGLLLYKQQWNTRWAFACKHDIFTCEDNMLKDHHCLMWSHNPLKSTQMCSCMIKTSSGLPQKSSENVRKRFSRLRTTFGESSENHQKSCH